MHWYIAQELSKIAVVEEKLNFFFNNTHECVLVLANLYNVNYCQVCSKQCSHAHFIDEGSEGSREDI